MNQSKMHIRHRFPPGNIQYAVWLYYRFNLSHRDIEDLLAKRGVTVSYEAIRLWCNKFGPRFSRSLRRKHQGYGNTFFIDVFLQKKRDGKAAKRFFKRLLRKHRGEPCKIVTDRLRSYGVAHRELIPETIHDTSQ